MKLYFYFLEGRKNGRIRMEECEVEEKARTYWPVGRFPEEYPGSFVRKADIGMLKMFCLAMVIMEEKDRNRVANIFSRKCTNDIYRSNDIIRHAKREIERSNELLDGIEEWKRENM